MSNDKYKDIKERCKEVKKREYTALDFLKSAGIFYGLDVYIDEGYGLDVCTTNCAGEQVEIADLKLQSTIFIDRKLEPVQNQQNFYFLSETQLQRYYNKALEDNKDYMIYIMHFFLGEHLYFLNNRFSRITNNFNIDNHIQEEVSVLCCKVKEIADLHFNKKAWTTIKLKQELKNHYQKDTANGKIIKINRADAGTYINLNRQWHHLTEEQRTSILW